jgi:hypothetical protein
LGSSIDRKRNLKGNVGEMSKETIKATVRKASKEISLYRKDFVGNQKSTIETLAGGSVCARIKAKPGAGSGAWRAVEVVAVGLQPLCGFGQ